MKREITIALAAVMLLTALTGCGGVKEEDIIGTWTPAYYEYEDGTREEYLDTLDYHITFCEDGIIIWTLGEMSGYQIYYTWKISGSDKIMMVDVYGKESEYGTYSDGEIVCLQQDADGSNRKNIIYIKEKNQITLTQPK